MEKVSLKQHRNISNKDEGLQAGVPLLAMPLSNEEHS